MTTARNSIKHHQSYSRFEKLKTGFGLEKSYLRVSDLEMSSPVVVRRNLKILVSMYAVCADENK
jgi:hypothetical protein